MSTWVNGSSVNRWHGYITYRTVTDGTSVKVYMDECGMESESNGFDIGGVSAYAVLSGQGSTSGSGSFYSAYNTTAHTSYCSGYWDCPRGTSAQTVTLSFSVSESAYRGGTSTGSVSISVPEREHHSITFDANGGTGAPSGQTKWYGDQPTLSSTKPTRSGYTFVAWNTAKDGSGETKHPGDTWGGDFDVVFYAQWHLDYVAPTISALAAGRSTSAGASAEDGTYLHVTAGWAVDTTISSTNVATGVAVDYKLSTATTWTSGSTSTPSAASGTVAVTIGGSVDPDKDYVVRLTVTDSGGSSSATVSVSSRSYVLDFSPEGGVGIGCPAPATAGALKVAGGITDSSGVSYAQLGDGWHWLVGPYGDQGVRYRQSAGITVVVVNLGGDSGISVTTSGTTLGTMPVGFRPVGYPVIVPGELKSNNCGQLEIGTDGVVKAISLGSATRYYCAQAVY